MAKGTFGERLKRERELREVTLQEVTAATRISLRFLEALENERWDKLPGGVFGRGFVRTIARFLGLDEESLLAEYDLARGEAASPQPSKQEQRIPSPPKWIPALAVLLILAGLVVGGIYGWRKYKAHRQAKQSSSLAMPAPPSTVAASDASSPAPSVSAPLELSVSTSTATRVRVVADDKLILDADLPAGETRRLTASNQFEVTVADSSAVLLELNGQVMRPLGTPGSSGTMVLSWKDLRQASGGVSQP